MKNIAIFASGSGSNAENIILYFQERQTAHIRRIYTNKAGAFVLERAKRCNIPSTIFSRAQFRDGWVLQQLEEEKIDFIVLAGFLWLLPEKLINRYEGNIINIHPSLLPKYGGKGMYGEKVHEAVIENGEKKSGITIHLVNEEYDQGEILFQADVQVEPHDTPDTLATKIHQLEYQHYPEVIEEQVSI